MSSSVCYESEAITSDSQQSIEYIFHENAKIIAKNNGCIANVN